MPQMYCLTCFYDLRRLPEHRCPECGRIFSPLNPASYSRTPHKERFQKLVKQASAFLSDALNAVEPVDPVRRAAALRKQIRRLAAENSELRQQLAALTQVLVDQNAIEPEELAAVQRLLRETDMTVIDDTESLPTTAVEPTTEELMDLRRAVEDQQAT
jgi:hypothetical protein